MSPRARHPGAMLAATGAAAAALSLWMPWYRLTIPAELRTSIDSFTGNGNNPLGALVHGFLSALPASITANGWQALHGADVALLLVAGAVLVALRVGEVGAAAAGGVTIAAIAVVHLLDPPGPARYVDARYGIWVALVGGGLVALGAWWANAPAPPRSTSALPVQEPTWPAHEPGPPGAGAVHSVAPPGR